MKKQGTTVRFFVCLADISNSMLYRKYKISVLCVCLIGTLLSLKAVAMKENDFISYTANPKKQQVSLYWKDNQNHPFKSIRNLKAWLEYNKRNLVFAMNAGMYKKDHSPQGLYIENGVELTGTDTLNGNGNFYLKPNGIFYITDQNAADISVTGKFKKQHIKFATQSGPMLLVDGNIHSAFTAGSKNVNIRNGVGILPNGEIVFAMSKKEINFYDFAAYFKSLGCKNALYLDGFVSRAYLPDAHWMQEDGDFGAMIAVVK